MSRVHDPAAGDTRTNVIRIADLREPRRTPAQQAAWDYGQTLQVGLDPAKIAREAIDRTGLSDFGDRTLLDFETSRKHIHMSLWIR